jgi:hypothetical protein
VDFDVLTNGAPAIMYSSGNHIVSSKSYTINPGSDAASHDGAGLESGFESVGSTNATSVCWDTRLVLTLFDRRGRARSRSRFASRFAPFELAAHEASDIEHGEDSRCGAEE